MPHLVQSKATDWSPSESAKALSECVTLLAEYYRHDVTPPTAKLWIEKLRQFDALQIRAAFDHWIEHESRFPAISDVLALIKLNTLGGPHAQWIRAFKVAQSGAFDHRYVVFDHPGIHFSIESMGGLRMLKRRLRAESDFSFAKRDFTAALAEYRAGQAYVPGFGTFNGSNVVLIGDAAKALTVYAKSRQFPHDGEAPGLELLDDQGIIIGGFDLPHVLLAEHLFVPGKTHSEADAPWMLEPPTSDKIE